MDGKEEVEEDGDGQERMEMARRGWRWPGEDGDGQERMLVKIFLPSGDTVGMHLKYCRYTATGTLISSSCDPSPFLNSESRKYKDGNFVNWKEKCWGKPPLNTFLAHTECMTQAYVRKRDT
jgi:hypothetical protein